MSMFTNGVGRPSNETIRKRNIFKGICVLLVLVIIGLVGYILNDKGVFTRKSNNDSKNDNNITTTKITAEELNIDSGEAVLLFDKYQLNMSMDVMEKYSAIDYFGYFYSQENIKKDDVSDFVKFGLAIKNLYVDEMTGTIDEAKIKSIKKIDIDEKIKEMFNSEIDYNILSKAEFYGKEFTLNKDGSFTYKDAGIGSSDGSYTFTKIMSAKKYNNKIEITNKVIFLWGGGDAAFAYKTFRLGEKEQLQNQIANLSVDSDEHVDSLDERLVDKYIDKLDSYKWTFVKKNDNYIFESVEKIK